MKKLMLLPLVLLAGCLTNPAQNEPVNPKMARFVAVDQATTDVVGVLATSADFTIMLKTENGWPKGVIGDDPIPIVAVPEEHASLSGWLLLQGTAKPERDGASAVELTVNATGRKSLNVGNETESRSIQVSKTTLINTDGAIEVFRWRMLDDQCLIVYGKRHPGDLNPIKLATFAVSAGDGYHAIEAGTCPGYSEG